MVWFRFLLSHECNRLWFVSDSCYPSAFSYWSFGYLLFCLEWIMKATCCLLRYNRAFMFGIVNLSMSYLCCEMPQKSCQYLHLILFFSPSQRAHGWPMNEVSFEDIFISYFSCSVSMISSLLWLFLVLGPCSVHELWERKSGFDCELLQGYMFTRFRWHGRTELNRKDFRWFNTPASSTLFFF